MVIKLYGFLEELAPRPFLALLNQEMNLALESLKKHPKFCKSYCYSTPPFFSNGLLPVMRLFGAEVLS